MFVVPEPLSHFLDFAGLVALAGTPEEENHLTPDLGEIDANCLSKFEFVQAAAQVLSNSEMIAFLDCPEASLHRPSLGTIELPEPVHERSSAIPGFVDS